MDRPGGSEGARAPRRDPRAPARDLGGLCPHCPHVRKITSERGSLFLLCELSRSDARFPRYPAQPRMVCSGYPR